VAVPCPACGREYDVALFAFGRTLHCTCGRRVGLAPRVRRVEVEGRPRFFADAMCGRLARWLRVLGYDVAYEAEIGDEELVRRAVEEDRAILTRDRRLPEEWRVSAVHVLRSESGAEQLREVVEAFGLREGMRPFSRCSRCNTPLEEVRSGEVRDRVPARVLAQHDRFRRCPSCGRIYWSGSHTARMRRVLHRLLDVDVREDP
jgi:uncharacterized protein with PIN domain